MRESARRPDADHRVCRSRPPGRPRTAGPARLVNEHRSSSAASLDTRSPSARAAWTRATSMRPRESEGTAADGDEDDKGAVRSEGSGPQSWPRAPQAPDATGAPRTQQTHPKPTASTHESPPPLTRPQKQQPKKKGARRHPNPPYNSNYNCITLLPCPLTRPSGPCRARTGLPRWSPSAPWSRTGRLRSSASRRRSSPCPLRAGASRR